MRKDMKFMMGLAAFALLAACQGPNEPQASENHVKMAKLCVDAGGEAMHCECQAAKVDELVSSQAIDPAVQRALILQAEGKEDEADALLLSLPYDQRFEQPSMVAEAMLACDAPG
jgi:hypothetical protein